jgi:hypothetical protein
VLEVRVADLLRLAARQPVVERPVGPAGEWPALVVHLDERRVLPTLQGDLRHHLDPLDPFATGRGNELFHGVEELDLDAALGQDLVQRSDHSVAHSGLHAPQDRLVVMEEAADGALDGASGGHVGREGVAVDEREGAVVDAAQERRVALGVLGVYFGTVAGEPRAQLQVVDAVEPLGQNPVLEDAGQCGHGQVDRAGQKARLVVTGQGAAKVVDGPTSQAP